MKRIASGMQEPVGIGVIGLGRWGELHLAGCDPSLMLQSHL